MTTWIFIRHGESQANLLHEFSNRGWKHGLTDLGTRQADHLLERLKTQNVEAIFTSPLLRAWQTAEILGKGFHLIPQITEALIEFDTGVLEGRSDQESWQLYADITTDWYEQKNISRQFEGGDSYESILMRFVPFFENLQRQYAQSNKTVLFVGHGGTYICVLPAILENINIEFARQHRLSNTGIVIAEEKDGKLYCLEWDGQIIIQP